MHDKGETQMDIRRNKKYTIGKYYEENDSGCTQEVGISIHPSRSLRSVRGLCQDGTGRKEYRCNGK